MIRADFAVKIAAFLTRPPFAALAPGDPEALAQAALGRPLTPAERSAGAEAERQARGLDIPAWVDDLPSLGPAGGLEFRHPLSGASRDLPVPPGLDPARLQAAAEAAVRALGDNQADDDPERVFLRLWRLLPQALGREENGVPWADLPADGRVPSHTWWEHASVASALAAALPDPAVLVFAIAGAQEFVGTARRTQDSWMGSFLLSYLSWQAVRVVAERFGPDAVLSPSLRGHPLVDRWLVRDRRVAQVEEPGGEALRIGNIPNQFTALVPACAIDEVAGAAEQAVRDAWEHIATGVRQRLEKALAPRFSDIATWAPAWERQMRDLPDRLGIFWGACPWGGADPLDAIDAAASGTAGTADHWRAVCEDLGEARRSFGVAYPWLAGFAAQALSARKNLRDFHQTDPQGEPGHKCTLCGQLSAVHPASIDGGDAGDLSRFWNEARKVDRARGRLKLLGRIRGGERLCAVCLTKRFALDAHFENELGIDRHVFPSTSTVAAAQFLADALSGQDPAVRERLLDHARVVEEQLRDWVIPANLPDGVAKAGSTLSGDSRWTSLRDLDGDWLYPDSFQPEPVRRELGAEARDLPDDRIEACRKSANTLWKQAKASETLRPPPKYYAVVAMDGDNMGEWLKGRRGASWPGVFRADLAEAARRRVGDLTRPSGPAIQLALSDGLRAFSLDLVKPLVDDYQGALVYAGGDDLLALVPAPRLYRFLGDVRRAFVGDHTGWTSAAGRPVRVAGGVGGMTVSAGVAVVHRSHELAQALAQAQGLLAKAKDHLGRNAFSVGLVRRSGELTEAGWSFAGPGGEPLPQLQEVLDLMAAGRVSTRLAYRVGACGWAEGAPSAPWQAEALRAEAIRLSRRHAAGKENRSAAEAAVRGLVEVLRGGLWRDPHGGDRQGSGPDLWATLSGLLLVTAFLSGREG